MYNDHFGFREIPFRGLADGRHVYLSAAFEAVRSELLEGLRAGARLMLLTGQPGVGKTKLLLHLRACVEDSHPVVYVAYTPLHLEDFATYACSLLECHPRGNPVADPVEVLRGRLRAFAEHDGVPIVLIDDADGLGRDVLEGLIDLFDLESERPLAHVLLAADPEIEDALIRPELRRLEEALELRSHLSPLGPEEVGPYIAFALRAAGYHGERLLTDEAAESVAGRARGVPKLVNALCDASLRIAAERGAQIVDADVVAKAAGEVPGLSPPPRKRAEHAEEASAGARQLDIDFSVIAGTPDERVAARPRGFAHGLRWPLAAVGAGAVLAITAALALVNTSAERTPADAARALSAPGPAAPEADILSGRIAALSEAVETARAEQARLKAELAEALSMRHEFAEDLASVEARYERLDEALRALGETRTVEEATAEADFSSDAGSVAGSDAGTPAEATVQEAKHVVPEPTPKPATYVVKPGDTLWRIAQKFGMTIEELSTINGLTEVNVLRAGQRLIITPQHVAQTADAGW